MSNEEYQHIQNILEISEDLVLGFIADERFKNSKERDYVDIENLLK